MALYLTAGVKQLRRPGCSLVGWEDQGQLRSKRLQHRPVLLGPEGAHGP